MDNLLTQQTMQTLKDFQSTKIYKPLGEETTEQRLLLAEYTCAKDTTVEEIQRAWTDEGYSYNNSILGANWYNDYVFILVLSDGSMETLIDRDYFNFAPEKLEQMEEQLFNYVD